MPVLIQEGKASQLTAILKTERRHIWYILRSPIGFPLKRPHYHEKKSARGENEGHRIKR